MNTSISEDIEGPQLTTGHTNRSSLHPGCKFYKKGELIHSKPKRKLAESCAHSICNEVEQ